MISKPQALKIARVVAGLCVSAGLIYFVYSKNFPLVVTAVIGLTIVSFSIFSKRPPALLRNPYITAMANVGSRKPVRDVAMTLVCFGALMTVSIGMAIGVRHKVIPDNNLTSGIWIVLMIAGTVATVVFLFRALIWIKYGPRRD
jgi:hypothetical protein